MYSLRTKHRISLFLFLIVFIIKSDADCTKENDDVVCSSLNEIKEGETKKDWEFITVLSSTKQQIEENALANIPNVRKLVFNGAVNKIKRNSFKGITKLEQLQFFNNDLLELNSNVFANLTINYLLIYTSNVKKLKPRCLDNLPNLKHVFIHQNSISNIPAGVFSYTSIEVLFLNVNGIRTIEEEAFYGMEYLKKLALEGNHLSTFDSNLYVGNTSPNLYLLWLARNYLTKIPKDMLTPFPKLKVLLMHINNIATIEEGSFNGLKDIRYIDLSNNKLENLSHLVFPPEGLEYLDIIFLQNNRFIYLSTDVIAKLPRLAKIAIGGNPWLCPCYQELRNFLLREDVTLLCDDEYLEGKRPVCVSPKVKTDKCTPEHENVEYLYEFYYNAQKDYLELPPLCKIYCDNNKSCYSHAFDVLEYS